MSDLVGNPDNWFARNAAHILYYIEDIAMPTLYEPRREKTGHRGFIGVSDQVRHKPDCAATEDSSRLENSDLGRRGIVLSV